MNKSEAVSCMVMVLRNTEASEEILHHKAQDASASSRQANAFVGLIFRKTMADGEATDLLDDELKFLIGSRMVYSFFGKGPRGLEGFLEWSRIKLSPVITQVVVKALWADENRSRNPKVPQ